MLTTPEGRTARWIILGTALGIAIIILLGWGVMRRQNGFPPGPDHPHPAGAPSRIHVEIAIEGMDCVMCAAGLQNELRALPGVTKAEVSYQAKLATIEYDPKIVDPARFAEMVRKSGFTLGR